MDRDLNSGFDLENYASDFGLKNKLYRLVWNITRIFLFRPFAGRAFKNWRNGLLRVFGAKLHHSAHIYASVKIWSPSNLKMGAYSTLGPGVDCYNQGQISIGDHSIISQKSYLCASTHNFEQAAFPLICKPIQIGDSVWVAADSFIGPGVHLGDGVVVGARAAVFKNIDAWTVAGGNPAQVIKKRVIKDYE